jgi:hypothetical protein
MLDAERNSRTLIALSEICGAEELQRRVMLLAASESI